MKYSLHAQKLSKLIFFQCCIYSCYNYSSAYLFYFYQEINLKRYLHRSVILS